MAAVRNLIVRGGADFSGLRQAMRQVGTSTRQMRVQVESATAGVSSAVGKMSGVIHKALAVAGVASIAALGKQAIDTASDLQEVQNVVDTAFGSMASSAEKFAKNAKGFGLSEIQAKKTSSTYMAMAKSLGVAEQRAAQMSMAAAALTGDMSSFFNVTQSVADTAVKSIWTGETESLKQFGVVLTEVNLQEYALSKGITTSYQSMSQAEKVMLRYNYVMEQLSYVQGDAAKTANSWANQTRTTGQRLKDVLSIFGSGLINVFDGAFAPINKAIDRLEYFARLFETITAKLFGRAAGSSGSAAIAAATGEAAASAADFSSEIEKAEKTAKRATLSIDQLHTLGASTSDSDSASGGSSDLLSGLGADSYYMQALSADDVIDDGMAAEIEARATEIASKIQGAMERVRGIADKVNVDNFVKGLKDALGWIGKNKETLITLGAAGATAFAGIKIGSMISSLGGLSGILKTVGTVIASVFGGFSVATLGAVAAIALVVAALVDLWDESESVRLFLTEAWDSLKSSFFKVGELISSVVDTTLGPALERFGLKGETTWQSFKNIVEGLVSVITVAAWTIEAMIDGLIAAVETIGPSVGEVIDGVVQLVQGLVNFVSGIITGDWSLAWDGLVDIVKGAVNTILGLVEGILNVPASIGSFVTGALGSGVQSVGDFLGNEDLSKTGALMQQSAADIFRIDLPELASGGVAYGESIVKVGEYAGAAGNPELIAPQSIISDTVEGANAGVIDAIFVMCSRVVTAIEQNRAVVNVGGKNLERDVTRQQNDRSKMTGKPILAV